MSPVSPHDSDIGDLVADSASKVFENIGLIGSAGADTQDSPLCWHPAAWAAVEMAGFGFAMLPDSLGGVGARHAFSILRIAGAQAYALPLAETMGGNWLLNEAGLPPVNGPLTVADGEVDLSLDKGAIRVRGMLARVPWARVCDIVCIGRLDGVGHVVRIDHGSASVVNGLNIAGEPRDECRFDTLLSSERVARLPQRTPSNVLRLLGAALRTAHLAGAIGAAVDMTVEYSQGRRQFGRPIATFQAIQQLIAVMATQAAASFVASDVAADALQVGLEPRAIAAAKIRAGEAAGSVAALAHQVHGAIGFTREHSLQLLTRRLWAWRDEFGSETEWSLNLGRSMIEGGHQNLWASLTAI
jgi:acyl-CoA dehydrogenase